MKWESKDMSSDSDVTVNVSLGLQLLGALRALSEKWNGSVCPAAHVCKCKQGIRCKGCWYVKLIQDTVKRSSPRECLNGERRLFTNDPVCHRMC